VYTKIKNLKLITNLKYAIYNTLLCSIHPFHLHLQAYLIFDWVCVRVIDFESDDISGEQRNGPESKPKETAQKQSEKESDDHCSSNGVVSDPL
jgi:hypothetical protein